MAFPEITFDGDFDTAQAVEGGPIITTDEVTKGKIITQFFCIKNEKYVPLTQGTPHPRFRDAYLVNESPSSVAGPILFFQRVYAALPPSRRVPRQVSFTVLGKSAADISTVTHQPIGFNQYGAAQPNTRNVNGTSEFSYSIDPNSFPRPQITRNTYLGAPVDFMGFVYEYQGQVKVNSELTEPRWRLAGSTFYTLLPALWIQEVNVTQWRGPIWQMEVVSVLPYSI